MSARNPSMKSGMDGKKRGGPNKGPGDFKRKVAKVGRKVKRANVTKITVASKNIHVPLQASMTTGSVADERAELAKLYKQIKHYSAPTRLQAVVAIAKIVAASAHTESYISMLVPKALELLFDEDGDTRKALLTLMADIVPRHRSEAFASIFPIVVTYICSGLTSLSALTQRDSLALLHKFTSCHNGLVAPHAHKLVVNVAALMGEAGAKVDLNAPVIAAVKAPVMPGIRASKYQEALSKKKEAQTKKEKGVQAAGAASAEKRVAHLLLLMQVLRAISSGCAKAKASAVGVSSSVSVGGARRARLTGTSTTTFQQGGPCVALTMCERGASKGTGGLDQSWVPKNELEKSFFAQLRVLWTDLSERPKLSPKIATVLCEAAQMVLVLAADDAGATDLDNESQFPTFRLLVHECFKGFPFSQSFAKVAAEGAEDAQTAAMLQVLDLTLCETAFVLHAVTGSADSSNTQATAPSLRLLKVESAVSERLHTVGAYLLSVLGSQIAAAETEAQRARIVAHDAAMEVEVNAELSGSGEGIAAEAAEGAVVKKGKAGDSYSGERMYKQEMQRRLWKCAELALPRYTLTAQAQQEQQQSGSTELQLLVSTLRAFIVAAHGAPAASNLQSMARPAMLSICNVCCDQRLWSFGTSFETGTTFHSLVECLVQLPPLLVDPAVGSEPDLDLFGAYVDALHTVISRTSAGNSCMPALSACVQSLFVTAGAGAAEQRKSEPCFYALCPGPLRLFLLELWQVTPMSAEALREGGSAVAATVLRATGATAATAPAGGKVSISTEAFVSAHTARLAEHRHFLHLFFSRRLQLGVDDVLDTLFFALRESTSRVRARRLPAAWLVSYCLHVARGDWLGADVAKTFHALSSSHAPTKIFPFVTTELEELCAQRSLHSKPASHKQGDPRAEACLWAAEYQTTCCSVQTFMGLLGPMFRFFSLVDSDSTSEDNGVTCENSSSSISSNSKTKKTALGKKERADVLDLCKRTVRVIIAGTATKPSESIEAYCSGASASLALDMQSAESQLLAPFVGALGTSASMVCVAGQTAVKFPLLTLYVAELRAQWAKAKKDKDSNKQLVLLKAAKRVLGHEALAEAVFNCRQDVCSALRVFMESLDIRSAVGGEGQVDDVNRLLASIP